MINTNYNNQITFQSKFLPSKARTEVDEYAKSLGYDNFINSLNKELKHYRNYSFRLKHHYSKPHKICKTEISYSKDNIPYKYTVMDNKITNPVELSFNILFSLKDKTSKAFKEIFSFKIN